MAVEQEEFVAEGLNEAGLSAGLFYFPGYGRYEAFDASKKSSSIADLLLVPLYLVSCATVEEVKAAVGKVHVVAVYPDASTVHWRFADASGRQLVLEIIDGEPIFYENDLGVLTNSPGFEWQLTNLNNYVNLYPGAAPSQMLGALRLSPFGAGSGFLGIPGDITPPSRFVRAAFYQPSAPEQATAADAVTQCFHILNNFDIPIGIETDRGGKPTDIPSATQWTAVTDVKNRVIYYRTMYDSNIRAFDLRSIDFAAISYRSEPLDKTAEQTVQFIRVRFRLAKRYMSGEGIRAKPFPLSCLSCVPVIGRWESRTPCRRLRPSSPGGAPLWCGRRAPHGRHASWQSAGVRRRSR